MDESRGARRYDKEYLLWQSTVAIKSDPVGTLKRGSSQKVFDFLVCFCEAHQISRFAPPDFFAPYMPRIDVAARRKVV
ncbi:MAG: hypothetical protein E7049_04965 [Lentisphaerae bacterium]|nr:hypothetical protein [Lentisphaerota bacterium]